MENSRPIIPSNNLALLRKLQPVLNGLVGNARQLRLVIDTNVILKDLRWLVSKRRDPAARTDLQELIASETVIAFVPDSLRIEVQEKIPGIALELDVGEERLQEEWKEYEKTLHLWSPKSSFDFDAQFARDPDDLPFVRLYQLVGAIGVYTRDKDVPAMGAPAITPEVMLSLREYARSASIALTFNVGGAVVLMTSIETVRPLVTVLKRLAGRFANLPKQIQFVLLVIGIVALTPPKSRKHILDALRALPLPTIESITALAPALVIIAETVAMAQTKADKSWRLVEGALPSPKRTPARVSAFAVCLAANKPLSVSEIEVGMRRAGYKARPRNSQTYLRRVIRSDERFIEGPVGYWSIQRTA